jgi:hypothetical protein
MNLFWLFMILEVLNTIKFFHQLSLSLEISISLPINLFIIQLIYGEEKYFKFSKI